MADKVLIAKLNNNNYHIWKYKLELLLIKEDLWDVVQTSEPKNDDSEWVKRDGKARATIGLLIEDNQIVHIKKESTANQVWKALENYHQKSTLSNKVNLLKKICNLKLQDNQSMEKHINDLENLTEQLSALGESIAENLLIAFLLSSLPESYNTLITALETRPEQDLTLSLVKNKLIEEFQRRGNFNEGKSIENLEKAMKTTKVGMHSENTKDRNSCFFCKKPGHLKQECRKYLKWKEKNPDKTKSTFHKVKLVSNECKENDDYCFHVVKQDEYENDVWYIDSGASSHMSSNESFFKTLNTEYNKNIVLADGNVLTTQGIGEGILKCNYGSRVRNITVKDVLFVPELKGNLISVAKLTQQGLKVIFENNSCSIYEDGILVTSAKLESNLYKLNLNKEIESLMKIEKENHSSNCIHQWHRKFGHRNPEDIKLLENKAKGIKLSNCPIKITCEECIKGKMSRTPFPQESLNKSEKVMDLIHTDLCGPMQTETPSKKKYFLTMIDDFSRYTVVYLLNNKSEVYSKFVQYIENMKTQKGVKPKCIRSDRGGEYISKDIKELFIKEGIECQMTAPYSPQQNGVAERKNRTLMEMTRCMLYDANMTNTYWGEALITANYLQNRLPTKPLLNDTPFNKWFGKQPDVSHLQIFGCKTYTKIPDERRRKLEPKAKCLTFVGYAENTKGYRLLDTETNRITISRDVKFLKDNELQSELKTDEIEDGYNTHTSEMNKNEDVIEIELTEQREENRSISETTPKQRISERSTKGIKPKRLIEEANIVTENMEEPRNYNEAINNKYRDKWIVAMNEEFKAFERHKVWELTKLPEGKKAVGSKWIYKIKYNEDGTVNKYKARLVAQGFSQKFGVDYDEVYAPVAKTTTLRTLLTIAGRRNMVVKHLDIETAYLNGDLSHEVYLKQPKGYEQENEEHVYKLLKNIYGLKQGAHEWNRKLNDFLILNKFIRSDNDPCLYSKCIGKDWMYLLVYVDDLICVAQSLKEIEHFKADINQHCKIKDLGELKYYLGLQFERESDGIFKMHQTKYIERKLKEYGFEECKPSNIPMDPEYQKENLETEMMKSNEKYRSAIGSLLYLATNTRPDIMISTSILARKVSNPSERDWSEVKRVFKYLKGTKNEYLKLGATDGKGNLVCYVDADWGGDCKDRKSNSGYCFNVYGSTIHWSSKKQQTVALSSTEAEFVALAEAAREGIWIERILNDLHENLPNPLKFYEDNQSCIKMLESEKFNQRTKHIETKYHFICDLKKDRTIEVEYCPTEDMIADMLTKPLNKIKLQKFRESIGLNDSRTN